MKKLLALTVASILGSTALAGSMNDQSSPDVDRPMGASDESAVHEASNKKTAFDRLDSNNDQYISKGEAGEGAIKDSFEVIDVNDDNMLSYYEFVRYSPGSTSPVNKHKDTMHDQVEGE